MQAKSHELFQKFPLTGSVNLSTGPEKTPYHVYDGDGLIVFGNADLAAIQDAMDGEDVYPVETPSGDAAMGIICCDFRDASHGPHKELQVFVLSSREPGKKIGRSAFALSVAMVNRQAWGTLCLHLWNDSRSVVAYNTEYLGLNARHSAITFNQSENLISFECADAATGPLLRGEVRKTAHTSLTALWEIYRLMGLRHFLQMARAPYTEGSVINKKGDVLQENLMAPVYTAPDTVIARHWRQSGDELEIFDGQLSAYRFQPRCLQVVHPFRFVYLHPELRQ